MDGEPASKPESSGAILSIALEEGFSEDLVVISLDGVEVYRQPRVATRLQIGLADSFELQTAASSVTVAVALPDKGLATELELEVAGVLYLGISISPSGELVHRRSTIPFGYV